MARTCSVLDDAHRRGIFDIATFSHASITQIHLHACTQGIHPVSNVCCTHRMFFLHSRSHDIKQNRTWACVWYTMPARTTAAVVFSRATKRARCALIPTSPMTASQHTDCIRYQNPNMYLNPYMYLRTWSKLTFEYETSHDMPLY